VYRNFSPAGICDSVSVPAGTFAIPSGINKSFNVVKMNCFMVCTVLLTQNASNKNKLIEKVKRKRPVGRPQALEMTTLWILVGILGTLPKRNEGSGDGS